MEQENRRAAQRAHDNVGLPDEYYDDEGRPAAARARLTARAVRLVHARTFSTTGVPDPALHLAVG